MRRAIFLSLMLPVCLVLFSCQDEKDVTLTGTIAVKGNMPFARTVFITEDGKSFVVSPSEEKIGSYQGKKIRVQARAYRVKLETVDGKHSFVEWHLKDIKILDQ